MSYHVELAIWVLLNEESNIESKLSLLTEIGIASSNDETFKICEKFRERLCSEETEKVGADDIHTDEARRDIP